MSLPPGLKRAQAQAPAAESQPQATTQAPAAPPKREAESTKPGQPEEKDWLDAYYRDPQPGQLTENLKDWSQQGLLQRDGTREVLIGFLSQVLRQNREHIKEWNQNLAGLPPEDQRVWYSGLWYSHTSEADALLQEVLTANDQGGAPPALEEAPKILEMPLDNPATLDMLWGFFFATGSESPIRRLVAGFRFEEVTEPPPGAAIPQGYSPLYEQIPELVAWSLRSMVVQHPRVAEICQKFYESPKEAELSETERRWLREKVLPSVDPQKYPPPPEPAQDSPPAKAEPPKPAAPETAPPKPPQVP